MMENEMYFDHEDREDMPKAVRHRKKKLYSAIRDRMEFYFSDSNLQKDRFLSKLLQESPEVDLTIFLRFNRIQHLTHSLHDLTKALRKSEFLQLTEDKTRVFRTTPVKVKENVDKCTIYVEQLTPDADHDWLKEIFSKYGKVDYISIPKYKASDKIKGFAFVEFEKPESAQKALEEFEKEGCCLTSHMNPDQLCSIATFEEDKGDIKEHNAERIEDSHSKPSDISDDAEYSNKTKKARKRKNTEELVDEGTSKDKKSKLENSDGNGNEKVTVNGKEEVGNTEKPALEENQMEENQAAHVKKKKNRKKKKSLKTKYVNDIKMYGLQILSKEDWKRLRNKYLNVQKEKMKRLKQHLYKSQMNHAYRQQLLTAEPANKCSLQFTSGLVVKVVFDGQPLDANQADLFKINAKSLEKVKYVDVKEGSKEGYIRFSDADTAQEIVKTNPQSWENLSVLKGAEETAYWDKMMKDRQEKFQNKKLFSKRGRNKLVNRAEKLISKRIRLSVDE